MAGIMIGVNAYSFKLHATQLELLNLPKPAWLDWARIFALIGGPVVIATGLWLLIRR